MEKQILENLIKSHLEDAKVKGFIDALEWVIEKCRILLEDLKGGIEDGSN